MIEYSVGEDADKYQIETTMYGEITNDDVGYVAEEAAEDFWSEHDGWEASWPQTIWIYSDGEEIGKAKVDMETQPVFRAI